MKIPRCDAQRFRPREADRQCLKPPHPASEPHDFGPEVCPTCGQQQVEQRQPLTREEVRAALARGAEGAKEIHDQLERVFRPPENPVMLRSSPPASLDAPTEECGEAIVIPKAGPTPGFGLTWRGEQIEERVVRCFLPRGHEGECEADLGTWRWRRAP